MNESSHAPTDPPSADRCVACRHLLRRVIATVLLGSSRPRLYAAIVDRLTFTGNIIETGTGSYRLAHALAARNGGDTRTRNGRHQVSPPRSPLGSRRRWPPRPALPWPPSCCSSANGFFTTASPAVLAELRAFVIAEGVHPATALGWFTDSLGFVTDHPGPGE